ATLATVRNINSAAVFFDNLLYYSKTKPCTRRLGGDIGFEHPRQHLRRKARPVIRDHKAYGQMFRPIVALRLRKLSLHINSRVGKWLKLNGRVTRIGKQIMYNLAKLRHVAFDLGYIGIEFYFDTRIVLVVAYMPAR